MNEQQFIEVDGIRVDAEYVRRLRGQNAELDEKLQKLTAKTSQLSYAMNDDVLERMYETYANYLSPVDKGLAQHMEAMRQALNIYLAEQQQQEPVTWHRLTDRAPEFDKNRRVVIYTDGYDFGGEQFFHVPADHLCEAFFQDEADQPEECQRASHWIYADDLASSITHPQQQAQGSTFKNKKPNSLFYEIVALMDDNLQLQSTTQLIDLCAKYEQPRAAVSDGWKLVPIEPTEEMLKAADDYHSSEAYGSETYGSGKILDETIDIQRYQAMLAAAPAQQATALYTHPQPQAQGNPAACNHEWTSTSLDKPYTIFCGKCLMRQEQPRAAVPDRFPRDVLDFMFKNGWLDDPIAIADGIVAAIGTEFSKRVTDRELQVATIFLTAARDYLRGNAAAALAQPGEGE